MSEQWPGPISMRELAELAEANVRALARLLTSRLDALAKAPSVVAKGLNGSGEGNGPGERAESGKEAPAWSRRKAAILSRASAQCPYPGCTYDQDQAEENTKRTTTSWGAPLPEGVEAGADWWYVPAESNLEGVEAPPGNADIADIADGCGEGFTGWSCTRHPAGTRHQATERSYTRVVAEWGIPADTTPTTPAIGDELTVEQMEALPVGAKVKDRSGYQYHRKPKGWYWRLGRVDPPAEWGPYTLHSLPEPEPIDTHAAQVGEIAQQFADVAAVPTILVEKPEMPTWTPLQRISREQAEGLPIWARVLGPDGALYERWDHFWVTPGMSNEIEPADIPGDTFTLLWHPDWAETEGAS